MVVVVVVVINPWPSLSLLSPQLPRGSSHYFHQPYHNPDGYATCNAYITSTIPPLPASYHVMNPESRTAN